MDTEKQTTPTPEDIAHAKGYMKGSLDAYDDALAIMSTLLKTIPKSMLLTNEGQANKALLKSLHDGFMEKRNAVVMANHIAKNATANMNVKDTIQ